jgi:hypothetical protein
VSQELVAAIEGGFCGGCCGMGPCDATTVLAWTFGHHAPLDFLGWKWGLLGNMVYYIMSNEYHAVSSYALKVLGMVGVTVQVMR